MIDKIKLFLKGVAQGREVSLARLQTTPMQGIVDEWHPNTSLTPEQMNALHVEAQTYLLLNIAEKLESIDDTLITMYREEK